MAAPTSLNLDVPSGNLYFPIETRRKLAERAAYWRKQWQEEKNSNKIQISCVDPLSVQFYEDTGSNLWTLPDTSYTILEDDIVDQLAQPTWAMKGSRLYYSFPTYPF